MKKIIGIIGHIGGGKDIVADYISKKFSIPHIKISDQIKVIAKERGIEASRENLIKLGADLAESYGSEYLAKHALDQIPDTGVISGMRQLAQIEYLQKHAQVYLIGITASPEIRFNRVIERNKDGEAKDLPGFIAAEERENTGPGPQRLFECMKKVDICIENEKSLELLYKEIDQLEAITKTFS